MRPFLFLLAALAFGELSAFALHQPRWAWWYSPIGTLALVLAFLAALAAIVTLGQLFFPEKK